MRTGFATLAAPNPPSASTVSASTVDPFVERLPHGFLPSSDSLFWHSCLPHPPKTSRHRRRTPTPFERAWTMTSRTVYTFPFIDSVSGLGRVLPVGAGGEAPVTRAPLLRSSYHPPVGSLVQLSHGDMEGDSPLLCLYHGSGVVTCESDDSRPKTKHFPAVISGSTIRSDKELSTVQ